MTIKAPKRSETNRFNLEFIMLAQFLTRLKSLSRELSGLGNIIYVCLQEHSRVSTDKMKNKSVTHATTPRWAYSAPNLYDN